MAGHACHFPPWDRVYAFFRRRRNHDLVREFHDRLRRLVRERAGRDSEPGAGVIDSQSVKLDAVVGSDSRGFDGGKLINGASGTSWSTPLACCSR
uniref:Transposase IS701-like DDE domain-containing protein n=1 Tax=Streptomyces sp. NBC_00049 TaxID=2903617 RepID=A0AAU2JK04_9ACTN